MKAKASPRYSVIALCLLIQSRLHALVEVRKREFTQFDFPVQRQKNVSGFQISVDDLVLVKIDQGLQGLAAHDSDLRLRQWPLQF